MSFRTPVDIANRALQQCGAELIDEALGFAEVSKNARECSFAYDKLRKAELRRNVWRFAIRRAVLRAIDANTMLMAPTMWQAATTYFVGSIVQDETNQFWISQTPNNLNNQPENSLTWAEYFGPMTVSLYSSTTGYRAGELVYVPVGTGVNRVYLSLQENNTDNPATPSAWSAIVTYRKNQVVTRSSIAYMSQIDLNINQDPALTIAAWVSTTVYSIGQQVVGSDGLIYTSATNSNFANDPTTDGGVNWTNTNTISPWTTSFTGGTGSINWLQVGGPEFPSGVSLATLNIVYPVGSGPSSQSTTRNVFRLPAGFLRKAPLDPKAGSTSYLGASWGLNYDDWNFEGNFITSAQSDPIPLRFVADTVDVTAMDDMFCEGLAARLALAVCEPITQSTAKLREIREEYKRVMTEARTVNAIEVGPEEPPVDDYIACRA